MKIVLASTLAVLALAAAPFAVAAPAGVETVSIPVSKARLDLDNPRDAKVLMRRIDTAAMQACGADSHSFVELKRVVAASACHRDAVAGAMSQLNSNQAALTVTGVRGR
ncbi:UrcA family protein [Caulobacter sp. BK020]|uniref:UrcA family protein n=1 Tax=Caulobacter sp. BK020 TaxID=2512117 RepID=UPI0010504F6F|nr:UrcA family protein [Caulobacter sp. BK020]TCS17320.1 UrcA family protein [Caulobacter sp. BK020]